MSDPVDLFNGLLFNDKEYPRVELNPVLHRDESANINILVSDLFSEKQMTYLCSFFHNAGAKINVIYAFSKKVDTSKLCGGLVKAFYENARNDLKDRLISSVPVITIGQAIYAATYDTGIQVSGFYDSVFNDTFFYSPFLNNRVYPIDSFFSICAFGKVDVKTGKAKYFYDNWEVFFAKEQIKRAIVVGKCSLPRIRPLLWESVENPNSWMLAHTNNIPDDEVWVAVDSETGGFDKLSDPIKDITLSFNGYTAYHLNWEDINPQVFTEFLKKHKCIYANGKFDVLFFMFHGCELVRIDWDTMLAGHLLNEMRSNSLKTHAFCYTNYGGYDIELEKFKWKYPKLDNYTKIPDSIRIPYACKDAAVTYLVMLEQRKRLEKEPPLYGYYQKYCLPILNLFIKAEYKGFFVDWDKVFAADKELQLKIEQSLENVKHTFSKPDIDPNKKQELGKYLESIGWENLGRGKRGVFNVSKDELLEWSKQGHEEAKLLLEYSKWVSIRNTFIGENESSVESLDSGLFETNKNTASSGLWQYRSTDNRIHPTFHAFMTKSHRHRSSNPNFQNLPKRNKEVSGIVRSCYIPPNIVPCQMNEADQIIVFDRFRGCFICTPNDEVEIGFEKRVKILAKDLSYQDTRDSGVRYECYKFVNIGEYYILEIDGENLQAKIAASMSHDKNLCELFRNGGDFHNNNTFYILAQYQLFNDYKIVFEDGGLLEGKEWCQLPLVTRNGKELKNIYYGDILEGDTVDAKKVLNIAKSAVAVTYDEFCANAKKGRLKNLRDVGKAIGLSFIFGASANNLASGTLRAVWTPKMCEDFIQKQDLLGMKEQIIKNNKHLQGDSLLYYVVSSFFRSEFFKLYPELEKWIIDCANTASNTGYRRSPWGSRRLLPQLRIRGADTESGVYKNLCNIAVNSPVQDFETIVIASAMLSIDEAFTKQNCLSYIAGSVHDSIVLVVHKTELTSVLRISLNAFNFESPETYGVPYSGECNIADFCKGEFWGFGSRDVKWADLDSFK